MKPRPPKVDGVCVKSVVSKSTALDLILFSVSMLPQRRTHRRIVSQCLSETRLEFRQERLEQLVAADKLESY